MEKIRFGIIGCGGMATNAHVVGFNKIADKCQVTATCDIEEDRAKNTAELLGAQFYTTDYKQVAEHVDAVLIALPHDLHHEVGMFFLSKGVHVLMEKPLCNTERECLDVIEEAEKRDLTLMCAYPVPFHDWVVKLKELIDSGEYGEIFQMSIWTEQYTDCETFPWAKSAKRLGGGQLFSHGCHYIDLLLRFLGKPVSGTHFGTNKGTPWMEKEGNSNVVMKFENGAMGYHFGTWGARGSSHGYDFQIFTDKGFFEYNKEKDTIIWKCDWDPNAKGPKIIEWKFDDNSKQTQNEIEYFIDCIREHRKPMTDGRSALEGLRVIWKLYEAEENNTIADLRGLGF